MSMFSCAAEKAARDTDLVVNYRHNYSLESSPALALMEFKVGARVYALMAADNSCALIKSGKSWNETMEGHWFAVDPSWKNAPRFSNAHASSIDDGKTFLYEDAYMEIPRPEYQVYPIEVVWHRNRVDALKAEGKSQEERNRIMSYERVSLPWLSKDRPTQ